MASNGAEESVGVEMENGQAMEDEGEGKMELNNAKQMTGSGWQYGFEQNVGDVDVDRNGGEDENDDEDDDDDMDEEIEEIRYINISHFISSAKRVKHKTPYVTFIIQGAGEGV